MALLCRPEPGHTQMIAIQDIKMQKKTSSVTSHYIFSGLNFPVWQSSRNRYNFGDINLLTNAKISTTKFILSFEYTILKLRQQYKFCLPLLSTGWLAQNSTIGLSMCSQVLQSDKPRPLACGIVCVTSPNAACFSFVQPKNSGCRRQKQRRAPFDHYLATIIYPPGMFFLLFTKHWNVLRHLIPEFTTFPYQFVIFGWCIRLEQNIPRKCSGAQRGGDTPVWCHPSMTRAA